MTIAQTDQRLFKGSTAEILAFMPPSFDESTGGGVDQDVVVYWQVWGVSRRSYRACGHAGPTATSRLSSATAIAQATGSEMTVDEARLLAKVTIQQIKKKKVVR